LSAHRILKSLLRQKSGLVGLTIIIAVLALSILAGLFNNFDPNAIALEDRLLKPFSAALTGFHLLGTDALGRDIFARIIYGGRISLLISFAAVLISALLGVSLGAVAGFYRGWLDAVLMRIAELQMAFPFILLALTILAVLGAGLLQMVLVLGIGRWVVFARVVRGEILSLREREFVEASRAVGNRNPRIIFRHIMPNLAAPVIIVGSFTVATNILTEAALTFLGVGLDVSIPTWGTMLAEGREYLPGAWWLATFPGVTILITVLGINLFGDWLRDYFDPRLKT
jgi:peptide/nickel transport system permease protein